MSENSTDQQDAGSTAAAPDVVVEGDAQITTGSAEPADSGTDAEPADASAEQADDAGSSE